ncbi:ABC transporter substrate-binding protein [Aestuariibaculum suncheonense]|uniref:ABC transporter substrate-binding protein n=1 Tax=Aestuariibaculum suncheonense TaxID=1028745 RepID=A0A8J6QQU4_9FLAO|nr:ABC transporter substrate-binding protein [Aestuariibaculum suncheonense]MBD0834684.1 ABC transporter substrate-binding protein [Aestuariibaculum suncheonense]
MLIVKKSTLVLLIILTFLACKKKEQSIEISEQTHTEIALSYAKGFSISAANAYKILTISNPWPNSNKVYKYALVEDSILPKITLNRNEFDGIITLPIHKIVVTSTTHLPGLELLQVENTLVGFPGPDFISSEKIRTLVDSGNIRELGKNEGINTEVLLATQPDVVVGFGINGKNKSLETIKKSGIPVIFNGDWVESSPLAKAEWIKFFGVLFSKEHQADSIFKRIETDYLKAKKLAKNTQNKPNVLSGAMHKDIWYLPNGTSTEAQLLEDAHANYLWSDSKGVGSLSLNFETVFSKAKDADIWISPSNYTSLESLKNGNPHHATFKAFETKNIYSFTNTTGATGGVLYFELGMTRPDLVLKDLIKICHPELLENYDLYFFKRLE